MRVSRLAVLALFAAAIPCAFADSVVLNDGRRMTGEVIVDDASGVQLKVKGGLVTFKRDEVKEVVKGDSGGTGVATLDPAGARFVAIGNPEVDRQRERARDVFKELERASALARKDRNDADGLRDQVEACEKRIASQRAEREKLVERYEKARSAYQVAAAACGSGG